MDPFTIAAIAGVGLDVLGRFGVFGGGGGGVPLELIQSSQAQARSLELKNAAIRKLFELIESTESPNIIPRLPRKAGDKSNIEEILGAIDFTKLMQTEGYRNLAGIPVSSDAIRQAASFQIALDQQDSLADQSLFDNIGLLVFDLLNQNKLNRTTPSSGLGSGNPSFSFDPTSNTVGGF